MAAEFRQPKASNHHEGLYMVSKWLLINHLSSRLCFDSVYLSVLSACLFVCSQNNSKSSEQVCFSIWCFTLSEQLIAHLSMSVLFKASLWIFSTINETMMIISCSFFWKRFLFKQQKQNIKLWEKEHFICLIDDRGSFAAPALFQNLNRFMCAQKPLVTIHCVHAARHFLTWNNKNVLILKRWHK